MLPIAAEIATRLTREQAQSARPHAPVLPDEATRQRTSFVSRVLDLARHRTERKLQSPPAPVTSPRQVWATS